MTANVGIESVAPENLVEVVGGAAESGKPKIVEPKNGS
jgi:hypothetical protein